jgi:hypothetical protein
MERFQVAKFEIEKFRLKTSGFDFFFSSEKISSEINRFVLKTEVEIISKWKFQKAGICSFLQLRLMEVEAEFFVIEKFRFCLRPKIEKLRLKTFGFDIFYFNE